MKKTRNMQVGDIYLNPFAADLWILRKDIYEGEEKESWVLSLVEYDYIVKYDYVDGFIKVGNIYDLVGKERNE